MPSFLIIGDGRHVEFADCIDWLRRQGELIFVADELDQHDRDKQCEQDEAADRAVDVGLSAGTNRVDRSIGSSSWFDESDVLALLAREPVTAIIIAQDRPGQFSAAMFERLRAAAPLTPILNLLGSWCEGEVRTGTVWPGAVRIYAHQFIARMGAELSRSTTEDLSTFAPPFTRTEEDRLLDRGNLPPARPRQLIWISAIEQSAADMLRDVCTSIGYRSARVHFDQTIAAQSVNGEAAAALFDCSGSLPESLAHIQAFQHRLNGIPLIVLAGFPRTDDIQRALQCGAAAVLSKPFRVADLRWQIDQVLKRQKRLSNQNA